MIAVVDNYILIGGNEETMGSALFQGMLEIAAMFAKEHGLDDVKVACNPNVSDINEFHAFVKEFRNL